MGNRRKRLYRRLVLWSIAAVLGAGFLGAYLSRPQVVNGKDVIAASGDITTYYTFKGSVEAKRKQTVLTTKPAQIKDILVEKGEEIKKDATLATTTAGQKIKSKIDGEVTQIYAEEKSQLPQGAKLMEIVDYNSMQLKVQVDEYDLPFIKTEQEALVTIQALGRDINGRVSEIAKEGIYTNGMTYFNAIIDLEQDSDLRAGMSAEVKIKDKSISDVTVLPMWAIDFDDDNRAFVYMRDNAGLKKIYLTLGLTDGVMVEIAEGLSPHDIVTVPDSAQGIGSLSLTNGLFGGGGK